MELCMESSMHDVKILQSENPRVHTDRHQTSLSNSENMAHGREMAQAHEGSQNPSCKHSFTNALFEYKWSFID